MIGRLKILESEAYVHVLPPVYRSNKFKIRSTAGDVHLKLILEYLANFFIAQRFFCIFFGNHLFNECLNALRTHLGTIVKVQRTVEEELQLKYPVRSGYILARGNPAHGGFMHFDVFSNLLEYEWLQLC